MNTIGPGPSAILRAVAQLTAINGQKPTIVIEFSESSDWSSATFVGATHAIGLRLDGAPMLADAAATRICAEIAEADIPMPGYFVAQIAATRACDATAATPDAVRITLQALTIVD